jgi:hypothetical protein
VRQEAIERGLALSFAMRCVQRHGCLGRPGRKDLGHGERLGSGKRCNEPEWMAGAIGSQRDGIVSGGTAAND